MNFVSIYQKFLGSTRKLSSEKPAFNLLLVIMNIRKTKHSDLEFIVDLYKDANQFAKSKDIRKWTKAGLKKFPELNFVYIRNNEIIGSISAILISSKIAEINDISISQNHRNKRIWTKLMNKLMNILVLKNIQHVDLWVHRKNARAIPFYYNLGFKIKKTSITKNIDGVPDWEDIIILEKNI